jgi:asparagine synthase (glutamine-hydrolysing)
MQDTLRGPLLAALPYFDPAKITALLDRVPAMDSAERTSVDQVLMLMLSACALQDAYHVAG